jgi:hypothetical protein
LINQYNQSPGVSLDDLDDDQFRKCFKQALLCEARQKANQRETLRTIASEIFGK